MTESGIGDFRNGPVHGDDQTAVGRRIHNLAPLAGRGKKKAALPERQNRHRPPISEIVRARV
jgi:hypothetical protein